MHEIAKSTNVTTVRRIEATLTPTNKMSKPQNKRQNVKEIYGHTAYIFATKRTNK